MPRKRKNEDGKEPEKEQRGKGAEEQNTQAPKDPSTQAPKHPSTQEPMGDSQSPKIISPDDTAAGLAAITGQTPGINIAVETGQSGGDANSIQNEELKIKNGEEEKEQRGKGEGETGSSAPLPLFSSAEPPADNHEDEDEDAEIMGFVPPSKMAFAALAEFHAQIQLGEAETQKLITDRGFTEADCIALGYRTSCQANRPALMGLLTKYQPEALEETGLFVSAAGSNQLSVIGNQSSALKPNVKFCGLGVTGKRDAEGNPVRDWTNPVLIPYYDSEGNLMLLRPHKDNVKGVRPRLYVVRARNTQIPKYPNTQEKFETVIITESEFKGGIVYCRVNWGAIQNAKGKSENTAEHSTPNIQHSTSNDSALRTPHSALYGVAGLPGIQMCKEDSPGTSEVVEELFDWLEAVECKTVVIIFDNEEKGDPALPGYAEKPEDRYDSQIWARYLAVLVQQRGYHGRVGCLPHEWRDEKGKADWDGAAAMLTRKGYSLAGIRTEFLRVIHQSRSPDVFSELGLFDGEAEKIIKAGVKRLFRKRKCLVGGARELKTSRKLQAEMKMWKDKGPIIKMLATGYRETLGGYYKFKPLVVKSDYDWWKAQRDKAHEEQNWRAKWVASLVLKGMPHRFSDFVMEPMYCIQCIGGESITRLVKLKNISGETRLARLDPDSFSQPQAVRKWLFRQGNYNWGRGAAQDELSDVAEDTNRDLHGRMIHEIAHYGWKQLPLANDQIPKYPNTQAPDEEKEKRGKGAEGKRSTGANPPFSSTPLPLSPSAQRNGESHAPLLNGAWLADDGAIYAGRKVRPDANGILWFDGVGYIRKLDAEGTPVDREGEGFTLGRPRLHPAQGLRFEHDQYKLVGTDADPQEDDPAALKYLFQEWCHALKETFGGYDAYLVLGSLASFLAAPEVFHRFKEFPGLWVAGEKGGGKTTITAINLSFFGYKVPGGIRLASTNVGMLIASQQYCNWPIWLEEYQHNMERYKVDFVKSLYNRESPIKKEFKEGRRRILTNAVVTGEATSHDAATRSRFPYVQMAEGRRKVNHLEWLLDHQMFFFALAAISCCSASGSWGRSSGIGRNGRRVRR